MSETLDASVVRKQVRVEAPIERTFSVFVEQMETWWPARHHIGIEPFKAIFVEPRKGGRWYECDAKGTQCDWGTVLAWDPPHKVSLLVAPGAGLEVQSRSGEGERDRNPVQNRGDWDAWWSWSTADLSVTARATSSSARLWTARTHGHRHWQHSPSRLAVRVEKRKGDLDEADSSASHCVGGDACSRSHAHIWRCLRQTSPGAAEVAFAAMQSNHFLVMGLSKTYAGFYRGLGLAISIFLTAEGIVFWQLGSLAKTEAHRLRPILATFTIAYFVFG